jgi:bacterioferritin
MKGKPEVIKILDEVLRNHHAAYMQFWKNSIYLNEKGFKALAEEQRQDAKTERHNMANVAYRIQFLEGDPTFDQMGEVYLTGEYREILENNLKQHMHSLETLRTAVKTANDVQDYGSRDLVNEILKVKEARVDAIEDEIEKFETMGKQLYMSTKV